jgi:hypothetical protein
LQHFKGTAWLVLALVRDGRLRRALNREQYALRIPGEMLGEMAVPAAGLQLDAGQPVSLPLH